MAPHALEWPLMGQRLLHNKQFNTFLACAPCMLAVESHLVLVNALPKEFNHVLTQMSFSVIKLALACSGHSSERL